MNNPRLKSVVLVGALALVVVGVSLFVLGREPSPSPTPSPASLSATFAAATTQPKITWSTTSINVILSPGESTSSDLTFTSSQTLTNVTLSVVPQIAPFVTVQPNSIPSLATNQAQAVHLSIALATTTKFGTYDGTLQLKSGTTTFPQTVKVSINVWMNYTDTSLGLQFKVPSFSSTTRFNVEQASDRSIVDFQLLDPSLQEFFSVFEIVLYANPSRESLQQWFEANVDSGGILATNGTFVQTQLPNGLLALVLVRPIPADYAERSGPVEEAYVISVTRDRVASIVQSQENRLFLSGYTQEAITAVLKQILGTIQF